MAWYHVNSCDCPIGCCDCGSPVVSKREARKTFDPGSYLTRAVLKGKCSGCGLRSKDSICWRCSITLEMENEDFK